MADDCDVLIHMIQEQWTQARQSESQRAIMTNFIIIISSAILGFLVKTGAGKEAIPLTVFLTLLGILGAIVSEKLYERFYLHVQRVGRMMERLDELLPNAKICHLEEIADEKHRERFPVMVRIRLHYLWTGIHVAIAIIGSAYTLCLLVAL